VDPGRHAVYIQDAGIAGIQAQLGPILLEILDQQRIIGSLILTSQYPSNKWYERFENSTVADAILNRFIHRAHSIELKRESMRKLSVKTTT